MALFFSSCFASNNAKILVAKKPLKVDFKDTLSYLNAYRNGSVLPDLKPNLTLQNAAKNHAIYNTTNSVIGHDENATMPKFTGANPKDRAKFVGYKSQFLSENIAYKPDFTTAIDSLFSAIYHRFGFLDLVIDEVGFDVSYGSKLNSFVFLMGNSKVSEFCKNAVSDEGVGRFYKGFCFDTNLKALDKKYENWTSPKADIVKFPHKFPALAYFSGENPDPFPSCKITANPVSIEFSPKFNGIKMVDFELFKSGEKLKNTKIITSKNDINSKFSQLQFALFSLDVLEFDTKYNVVFSYLQDGKLKKQSWEFRTKTPQNEYFEVSGDEILEVEADKTYEIFLRPKNCNDILTKFSYSGDFATKPQIEQSAVNTLSFKTSGLKGSEIILKLNDRNVKIRLVSSTPNLEKQHRDYIIISTILIILVAILFVSIGIRMRKVDLNRKKL